MASHNLNLLHSFSVLLEECHVSKAAERLHITQSAVSRQLTQLRTIFQDPLLVREGNRLLPTPRALALKSRINTLLAECEELFEPVEFNPAHWRGKTVLSSSDYVAQYILPDIIEQLSEQAPHLDVTYKLWSPNLLNQLAETDIQLVSTMLPAIPEGLSGEPIGSDGPVCVMGSGHPLATSTSLTLEDFLHYHHISINGGGDKDSFVDQHLKSQGLQRTIRFSVPFFTSALNTLCRTDMLLVIPEHIAVNMQQFFPITFLPLPMPSPEHRYWLLWHPKYHNDPMHQWLRQQVLNIMKNSMYAMETFRNDLNS